MGALRSAELVMGRHAVSVAVREPMAVSPDGARLAYYDSERLHVLDVATGAE